MEQRDGEMERGSENKLTDINMKCSYVEGQNKFQCQKRTRERVKREKDREQCY